MKRYVKKHLRELIWFSFLNQSDIFLSHELFEFLYICYRKKKYRLNENGLRLILRKTVFDAIYNDNEGELKWISENNKDYRVLIKNDLIFLRDRSKNIMRKWFLVSYKQFLKITCDFEYEEEDIYFFDLIMEIDEEYKKMLMYCHNKGLSLEDEVYSILNVKNDHYIEDTENIKTDNYLDDDFDINNEEANGYYDYDGDLKLDEELVFGDLDDLETSNIDISNVSLDNKPIDVLANKNSLNAHSNVLKGNNNVLNTKPENILNSNIPIPSSSSTHVISNIKSDPIYTSLSSKNTNLQVKSNGYYIDSEFISFDNDSISSKAAKLLNKRINISLTPDNILSPDDKSLSDVHSLIQDSSDDEVSLSRDDNSSFYEKSISKEERSLAEDEKSLSEDIQSLSEDHSLSASDIKPDVEKK